jgi:hypothetical protein
MQDIGTPIPKQADRLWHYNMNFPDMIWLPDPLSIFVRPSGPDHSQFHSAEFSAK